MKFCTFACCHLLALMCATNFSSAQPQTSLSESDYYDIGGFHYKITTASPQAQTWFDRGLAMCHGFNHEEAVRCFERCLAADPGCPMALWGIAYAWGPNFNNMLIAPSQITKAEQTLHLAQMQMQNCPALHRKLIQALALRYATPLPENRDPLNLAYANAMREIYKQHPEDCLVTTLFAESLMNLQPWRHWNSDGTSGAHTEEICQVLQAGLQRWPEAPALCHLYIHAMEASPTPEKALPFANQLRGAMPGLGHLVHMPTHIDIWTGDYANVIHTNQRAIAADEAFLQREGPLNFYSLYRIHNYHFLTYGAMFDGQSDIALEAARAIKHQVPEAMLREQVDFLDAYMPTDLHVLVRFGRWEEILQAPAPADYLPMSRSIWHYARTLAYAATDRVADAETEQEAFQEAMESVPETSFLFQNASLHVLGVAEAMLAGEIAYRKGEYDQAFGHLREAVARDDALNYDEPWGWMQPARHALGALLLEQGHFQQAEATYREDLEIHPNNAWALHGLADALKNQGKQEEFGQCHSQFVTASKRSDVQIDRSCYCKLGKPDPE